MKIIFTPLTMISLALSATATTDNSISSGYPEGIKSSANIFYSGMKDGVAGYRIPSIVTAKDGSLIATIDERVPHLGDLKFSRNINIVVRRSEDNGKSWGEEITAIDFPDGKSASDPSMVVDEKTGYIYCFYNYMDLDKEKDVYYFHYVLSKDNGKTWSKPVDITEQITKPEWKNAFKFISSGRAIYTSDGKILHNIVDVGKRCVYIFGSDNNGKSWYVIDTPVSPADESKVMELSDGRWMINSRVNGAGQRHIHISDDKGKTWTSYADHQLPDPSCNGSIIRYSSKKAGADKDRLIFSNAASKNGRQNLALRISSCLRRS